MIVHYDTCRRCFVLQRCLIESFKYLRYLDIVYGLQISRCFRFLNKEIKCLNRRKTYSAGCSPSFVYVRANCTGEMYCSAQSCSGLSGALWCTLNKG